MIKLISSAALPESLEIAARIIDCREHLVKAAADESMIWNYDEIKPDKDHVGIHLIALGDMERYGCFFAGAPVQTVYGQKAIEDVVEGELVLTHRNRYRPVARTFESEYSGIRVSLKCSGLPDDVVSTNEHPVRVVPREKFTAHIRFNRRKSGTFEQTIDTLVEEAEWVPAERVRPGDFVVVGCNPEAPEADPGLEGGDAYMLGVYLADGCPIREYREIATKGEPKVVLFSLSDTKEAVVEYIQAWRAQNGLEQVELQPSLTSEYGVRLSHISKPFAAYATKTCGSGAGKKRVNPWIFSWSETAKLQFIAGYLDGDGSVEHSEGTVSCSTVSRTLALDLQRLLASVGVPSSVCRCHNYERHHSGEGFGAGNGDAPIFSLSVGSSYSNKLLEYTKRLKPHSHTGPLGGSAMYTSGNYLLSTVTAVHLDTVEAETRYNLEVTEDNSYVVDFQVHNSNRNADAFPKAACQKYHHTFVEHGHLYHHHQNKDPEKKLGDIVKSAYVEPKARIELFVHAHKEKAAPELEELAKKGESSFSMACFRAGTPVITRRGTMAIERVEKGDEVLTHTGAWRKVGNRSVRTTNSYVFVNLVSWGRTSVGCTDNHPFYAASFDQFPQSRKDSPKHPGSQFRRRNRGQLHTYLDWVPAGELTPYHYVGVPIDRVEDCNEITEDFARVLGYYTAEGSLQAGTTVFTCGVDSECAAEVGDLADWTSVTTTPKANSDKAVTVFAYGTELRDRIEELCSRTETKRIPEQIMRSSREVKMNFVSAWFNGDGWQDKNGLHWSTHLQHMAVDLQRLLASADIPSSCTRIDHPYDRGIVKSADATEYVVTVSNEFAELFSDISKAEPYDMFGRTKCRTFISGDYLMVPVKSVVKIDEPTEVFNFSVEGDESYTVYGLAVHNCKVPNDRCLLCNTLRKSAADPNQCDHVRYKLGQLLDDGRYVGVANDDPNFFDISFVVRPADRIAWNLKVACDEMLDSLTLAKEAELWLPESLRYDSDGAARKRDLARKLAGHEQAMYAGVDTEWTKAALSSTFTDEEVKSLRTFEPEDVMTALANAQIVMDPLTYCKYATGHSLEELGLSVDEFTQTVNGLFSQLVKSAEELGQVCNDSIYDVPEGTFRVMSLPSKLTGLLRGTLNRSSFETKYASYRAVENTMMQKEAAIDNPAKRSDFNCKSVENPLALKYAAYKLSAADALERLHGRSNVDRQLVMLAAQNLVAHDAARR